MEGALDGTGLVSEVAVLHLDRHGCAGASNAAWLEAALGGAGASDALIGGAQASTDCPAADVVKRVAARLDGGAVWASALGSGGTAGGVTVCGTAGGGADLTDTVAPGGDWSIACEARGGDAR